MRKIAYLISMLSLPLFGMEDKPKEIKNTTFTLSLSPLSKWIIGATFKKQDNSTYSLTIDKLYKENNTEIVDPEPSLPLLGMEKKEQNKPLTTKVDLATATGEFVGGAIGEYAVSSASPIGNPILYFLVKPQTGRGIGTFVGGRAAYKFMTEPPKTTNESKNNEKNV